MQEQILHMAEKLGLSESVKSAVLTGQDEEALAEVVFSLYCDLLKTTKERLTWTLAIDKEMPHASKLLGFEAIKRDVNYLWD